MPRVKKIAAARNDDEIADNGKAKRYKFSHDLENVTLSVTDAVGTGTYALADYPEEAQHWLMLEGLKKRFSQGESLKAVHDSLMDGTIMQSAGRGRARGSLWRTAIANAAAEYARKKGRELDETGLADLTDKSMSMSNADVQSRKSHPDVRRHYKKLGGVLSDDGLLDLVA